MRAYRKQLGLVHRKVAPIPTKAKPEVQEPLLAEELNPVLEEAKYGASATGSLSDASHFVFAAFLGPLWGFTRIVLPTLSGRQRYHVLGASNAMSHEVVTIANTAYNHSQSVVDRLTKLHAQFSELPMTLVLDKAAELNIQLPFLPPYSPNLNLIERLRKFVQAQCLNSGYHEPFAAFKQAMDASLTKTAPDDTLQLATLLTLKFQPFKAS